MQVPTLHVFIIKRLPANNTKPARIKISSVKLNQSVIIGYSNEPGDYSPAKTTAHRYLESKGFNIVGEAEGSKNFDYIITDNFKPLQSF